MKKRNYLITIASTFVATLLIAAIALVCVFRYTDIYGVLTDITAGTSNASKFITIFNNITNNHLYDVDNDKLIDAAINGMLDSIDDPYTYYMTAEQYEQSVANKNPTFVGIGVTINKAESDDSVVIKEIYTGSQLLELGIVYGDEIVAVEGERITATNKDDILNKIQGEEGTSVNITFRHNGKEITHTVERRTIHISQTVSDIFGGTIGYIRLKSFQKTSYDDFMNSLNTLRENGITSLIIDLRGNGGGYKDIALKLTDLFIPEGIICKTVTNNGVVAVDKSDDYIIDLPFVVLVDGTSASASELFAGAIQDHQTGTLIGTTTFGKGIVQYTYPLEDGSYYQFTAQQWLTPNGRYIQGEGLTPDIIVKMSEDIVYYIDSQTSMVPSPEYDLQLKAAIDCLSQKE